MRFKNLIGDYAAGGALDTIERLDPIVFTMKRDKKPNADANYERPQIGLSAENVAAIEPRCAILRLRAGRRNAQILSARVSDRRAYRRDEGTASGDCRAEGTPVTCTTIGCRNGAALRRECDEPSLPFRRRVDNGGGPRRPISLTDRNPRIDRFAREVPPLLADPVVRSIADRHSAAAPVPFSPLLEVGEGAPWFSEIGRSKEFPIPGRVGCLICTAAPACAGGGAAVLLQSMILTLSSARHV